MRLDMPIAGALGDKRKEAEAELANFKSAVGVERESAALQYVVCTAHAEADGIYFSRRSVSVKELTDRIAGVKEEIRKELGSELPPNADSWVDRCVSRRLDFLYEHLALEDDT